MQNGDPMGNNGRENAQAKAVAVQLGLSREQRDELHVQLPSRGMTIKRSSGLDDR